MQTRVCTLAQQHLTGDDARHQLRVGRRGRAHDRTQSGRVVGQVGPWLSRVIYGRGRVPSL